MEAVMAEVKQVVTVEDEFENWEKPFLNAFSKVLGLYWILCKEWNRQVLRYLYKWKSGVFSYANLVKKMKPEVKMKFEFESSDKD